MNKVLTLSVAIVSALAAATAGAVDDSKHLRGGHVYGHQGYQGYQGYQGHQGNHGAHRPSYVAPTRHYNHFNNHNHYRHGSHGGYWQGNRWIAPVLIGGLVAAAVGGTYAYNNYGYNYPASDYAAPSYVAPSYYAPATITYAAPARAGFDYADANVDGYVSFDEAAAYPHWQRNFGLMDRNRDGYLSRDEVNGWRYR